MSTHLTPPVRNGQASSSIRTYYDAKTVHGRPPTCPRRVTRNMPAAWSVRPTLASASEIQNPPSAPHLLTPHKILLVGNANLFPCPYQQPESSGGFVRDSGLGTSAGHYIYPFKPPQPNPPDQRSSLFCLKLAGPLWNGGDFLVEQDNKYQNARLGSAGNINCRSNCPGGSGHLVLYCTYHIGHGRLARMGGGQVQ